MFDCQEGVLFFEGFILFSVSRDDVLSQKALIWSHLSTGHSPRGILACSGVFLQTPVRLSYVYVSVSLSSGVLLGLLPWNPLSSSWRWMVLKMSYLVPEGQLESVWQLIEVLSPPFKQSFSVIFNQVFSCGHV